MNATANRPSELVTTRPVEPDDPVRERDTPTPHPPEPPPIVILDGITGQPGWKPSPTRRSLGAWLKGARRRNGPLVGLGVVAYLAALGLLFYAGTVQQSASDQQIHSQYYPAPARAYSSQSYTSSSYTPQVAAALAFATPPGPKAAATPVPSAQRMPRTGARATPPAK